MDWTRRFEQLFAELQCLPHYSQPLRFGRKAEVGLLPPVFSRLQPSTKSTLVLDPEVQAEAEELVREELDKKRGGFILEREIEIEKAMWEIGRGLPPGPAREVFDRYLELDETKRPIHAHQAGHFSFVAQVLRASLLNYLESPEPGWAEFVELAVLHLNNLLAADAAMAKRWIEVFDQKHEPGLERLGAVHFLQHGVFPFKAARGGGGATDLVVGEVLSPSDLRRVERAGAPLVLTEWKRIVLKDAQDVETEAGVVQTALSEAYVQLDAYPRTVIAALQLQSVRYAILVSKAPIRVKLEDKLSGEFTIRHLNIVVDPRYPSDRSRRIHADV